jgi:hypothetical protein
MIDKKTFKKVLAKAKHINKEIEDLRNLLVDVDDLSYFIEPSSFWLSTDILPELKAEYGGDIFREKYFDNGIFSAHLTIDGVRFVTDFIEAKEWEKYE